METIARNVARGASGTATVIGQSGRPDREPTHPMFGVRLPNNPLASFWTPEVK
jgi:hypothetical protein